MSHVFTESVSVGWVKVLFPTEIPWGEFSAEFKSLEFPLYFFHND